MKRLDIVSRFMLFELSGPSFLRFISVTKHRLPRHHSKTSSVERIDSQNLSVLIWIRFSRSCPMLFPSILYRHRPEICYSLLLLSIVLLIICQSTSWVLRLGARTSMLYSLSKSPSFLPTWFYLIKRLEFLKGITSRLRVFPYLDENI